MVTKSR